MLNRPDPNEPSVPDPLDDLNINTDPPPQAEGETATKAVKNGKASGIDSLDAEFITQGRYHLLTAFFAMM